MRSERYRRLDAQPAIRARTDFFVAASLVTRVLAYGGATPFMLRLSESLERVNSWRAQLICRGLLYGGGTIQGNTVDFIRYEQILVQRALDRLRRSHPDAYAQQIRHADDAIARLLQRRALCASGALTTFIRAADSCLATLGRMLEFSRQSDREALGEALARSARAPAAAPAAPAQTVLHCGST